MILKFFAPLKGATFQRDRVKISNPGQNLTNPASVFLALTLNPGQCAAGF